MNIVKKKESCNKRWLSLQTPPIQLNKHKFKIQLSKKKRNSKKCIHVLEGEIAQVILQLNANK